ncbi:hypothetical protein E3N88_16224 [Mikania micrantha]|uniref:Uncharacterized protein n=1 Tax=Mikania micrantha TaxID=192012 RepID=A0A5N6NXT6_9ASTR|nr:hypothetical protein E3N88_16224 [Mikania micrantha]
MDDGDDTTMPPFHHDTVGATTKHCHPSSAATATLMEFELVSIKPVSYTSLRDILPSSTPIIRSLKAPYPAANMGYEILIRNRLVKQAAWAYLQPMPTSSESGGSTVLDSLWIHFSGALFCLVATAFDCVLQLIHVKGS